MLRTILVDDDNLFIEILTHYLSKLPFIEIIGVFHHPRALLKEAKWELVDLIFVDMEMPGLSGIELLKRMGPRAPKAIIVSKRKEYGADAYDYDAVDYLCKPVSFERLQKAVNKVKNILYAERQSRDHIFVRTEGVWNRVCLNDILVIKASNNKVMIRSVRGDITSPIRMHDLLEQLPAGSFMQIHRSFIVNLTRVTKVDGEVLEVEGKRVPVSRSHLEELYKRLNIAKK